MPQGLGNAMTATKELQEWIRRRRVSNADSPGFWENSLELKVILKGAMGYTNRVIMARVSGGVVGSKPIVLAFQEVEELMDMLQELIEETTGEEM